MLITDINSNGFNSYASVNDCRQYAESRGLTIPNDDSQIEILLVNALDYLESMHWKGEPSDKEQPLSWPRKNIIKDSIKIPNDSIPRQIKEAQCYLAINSQTIELLPINQAREILSESIAGALSVTYAPDSDNNVPTVPYINRLLRGLCYSSNTVKVARG